MTDDNTILQHGEQCARHLSDGLADNWSQVRTKTYPPHLPLPQSPPPDEGIMTDDNTILYYNMESSLRGILLMDSLIIGVR